MVDSARPRNRASGPALASAATLMLGAGLLSVGTAPALADSETALAMAAEVVPSPMRFVSSTVAKPNIVVIMLDDVGPHDGRIMKRLPTIRSTFLERGTEFTDFHVQTPACSPGRVGFLTGLHTHHHGVIRNVGSLFKPQMSIATQLRGKGYRPILAGKYLNSMDSISPKVPPGWADFHAIDKGFYNYTMWSNGRKRRYGAGPANYSTDVIARKAVASIARTPRHQKVFAWIAPYAAHSPNVPARRHRSSPRCEDLPRWKPPGYMEKWVSDKPAYIRAMPRRKLTGKDLRPTCRSLLAVDNLVRDVKAELQRQGRLRNTLLILTADNGMNDGMHRFLYDKKTPYATAVPFLVSWPKVSGTRPRKVNERLENIDLAPTLCALAGCSMGPYPTGQARPDGRSFAPILLGTSKTLWRGSVLHSFRRPGARVPRWWGIETTRHSTAAGMGCSSKRSKGCRWSFVKYETGERELYDLSNGPCHEWRRGQPGDPCRLNNLAGHKEYRYIQRWLNDRLEELKKG